MNYELRHIGAYNPYSATRDDWQDMFDRFIREFTGSKELDLIVRCDDKYFTMSFDLIRSVVFKDDDSKLEEFYALFE